MPPIMGVAMRFMASEPVPVLHMMGSSPAMVEATVIILGRTRMTAPSMMASLSLFLSKLSPYMALNFL